MRFAVHIYDVVLILVSMLFGAYGLLSTFELGVALFRLSEKPAGLKRSSRQLFTPLWEITNTFLVFGFTGFAVLFNNSLGPISQALLPVLSISIIALLLRACFVLQIFYRRDEVGMSATNIAFALCSLAVPVGFGAAGIHLLVGSAFWQTAAGWCFFIILLLGILSLATGVAAMLEGQHSRTLRNASLWSTLLFGLFGGVVLQHALRTSQAHLITTASLVFVLLVDAAVALAAWLILSKREKTVVSMLSAIALFSPLLWFWANRPYLLYPSLSVADSFGAQAYGVAAVIGLGIIFPVVCLGFWLFAKLYLNQSN